ncbi:hypothetical protein BDR07DRAFT_1416127 [Suillus spraguei]|nr:hypothetical protein BDR07DRAFT_1416127 [Suillus spraguei]
MTDEDEEMQWEEKLGHPIINDILVVKNPVWFGKGRRSPLSTALMTSIRFCTLAHHALNSD